MIRDMNEYVRYKNDRPIRFAWDDDTEKWWMCATDAAKALTDTSNPRVYWATVKRRNPDLFANCKQLKFIAADGKMYNMDVIDNARLDALNAVVHSTRRDEFLKYLASVESSDDKKVRERAYELFNDETSGAFDVGNVRGLQQLHSFLFEGIIEDAGQIRTDETDNITTVYTSLKFLPKTLDRIDRMTERSLNEIISKYVEMNTAHPFMSGNGRSIRLWFDMIIKKRLQRRIDWTRINTREFIKATDEGAIEETTLLRLVKEALTDRLDDRNFYKRCIDSSFII